LFYSFLQLFYGFLRLFYGFLSFFNGFLQLGANFESLAMSTLYWSGCKSALIPKSHIIRGVKDVCQKVESVSVFLLYICVLPPIFLGRSCFQHSISIGRSCSSCSKEAPNR
jgi:hypothetical protein